MSELKTRQPEPEVMDTPANVEAYAAADFSQVNQAFVDCLLTRVGLREAAVAIDLGTGPADIPIRLAAARPTWRIVAVDAAPNMLTRARRDIDAIMPRPNIELVLADAKTIPLPSQAFDVVFSNSILHHLTDPLAFWREVRRLARPGAIALMRDLARPATSEIARSIVQQYAATESPILQEDYYRSLLAAYTPDEIRSQLTESHLGMLQVAMITDRHLDVFGHVE